MKRSEARRQVERIYREYRKLPDSMDANKDQGGALHFYGWLRNNHPEALEFRHSGDAYQIITSWIEDMAV